MRSAAAQPSAIGSGADHHNSSRYATTRTTRYSTRSALAAAAHGHSDDRSSSDDDRLDHDDDDDIHRSRHGNPGAATGLGGTSAGGVMFPLLPAIAQATANGFKPAPSVAALPEETFEADRKLIDENLPQCAAHLARNYVPPVNQASAQVPLPEEFEAKEGSTTASDGDQNQAGKTGQLDQLRSESDNSAQDVIAGASDANATSPDSEQTGSNGASIHPPQQLMASDLGSLNDPAAGAHLAASVETLIERVIWILRRDRIRQKDLASAIGLSGSTLSPMLRGKYRHTKDIHILRLREWAFHRDKMYTAALLQQATLLSFNEETLAAQLGLSRVDFARWIKLSMPLVERTDVDNRVHTWINATAERFAAGQGVGGNPAMLGMFSQPAGMTTSHSFQMATSPGSNPLLASKQFGSSFPLPQPMAPTTAPLPATAPAVVQANQSPAPQAKPNSGSTAAVVRRPGVVPNHITVPDYNSSFDHFSDPTSTANMNASAASYAATPASDGSLQRGSNSSLTMANLGLGSPVTSLPRAPGTASATANVSSAVMLQMIGSATAAQHAAQQQQSSKNTTATSSSSSLGLGQTRDRSSSDQYATMNYGMTGALLSARNDDVSKRSRLE